jgi:hypothetical protein
MFRVDPKQAISGHASREANPGTPLSDPAEEIIARPVERTYSGNVISGVAQLVEAGLLIALGFGIQAAYVPPGDETLYTILIVVAAFLNNIGLNALRTHRVPAYRRVVGQVGRVLAVWASVIAILTAVIFFLKAGDMVSRVRWCSTGPARAGSSAVPSLSVAARTPRY